MSETYSLQPLSVFCALGALFLLMGRLCNHLLTNTPVWARQPPPKSSVPYSSSPTSGYVCLSSPRYTSQFFRPQPIWHHSMAGGWGGAKPIIAVRVGANGIKHPSDHAHIHRILGWCLSSLEELSVGKHNQHSSQKHYTDDYNYVNYELLSSQPPFFTVHILFFSPRS